MALAPATTLAGPATAGTTPSPGDPSEAPPGRIQGNGRGRLFPTGSSAALLVIWGFIDRNRLLNAAASGRNCSAVPGKCQQRAFPVNLKEMLTPQARSGWQPQY